VKKSITKYLLWPFSIVYGIVVFIRNKLFDWKILPSHEFDLPVISVGNITVGGTGKTPVTEYLVRLLKEDYKVAVLSRGYGRKSRGFFLAGKQPDPAEIGDEPCQIKMKFPDIMVAVDARRVRGIQKLRELGAETVILDDAFQHRYVKAGLSILLIDYSRPVTKDYLLPFGRLRESTTGISRANILLITKSPADLKAIDMRVRFKDFTLNPFQHLYFSSVIPEKPLPVFISETENEFPGNNPGILLVTGIARPASALGSAGEFSSDIRQISYSDHHDYNVKDVRFIIRTFQELKGINKVILTTEKDAVKFRLLEDEFNTLKNKVYYMPVMVSILNNDTENFNTQIKNYVRSNKRDRILHKGEGTASA
jgi:tetraacyldisaccharide 4'-kinase